MTHVAETNDSLALLALFIVDDARTHVQRSRNQDKTQTSGSQAPELAGRGDHVLQKGLVFRDGLSPLCASGVGEDATHREIGEDFDAFCSISPAPGVAALHVNLRPRFRRSETFGRRGDPDECAHAVMYLLDERAGYVTGSVVTVDGGLSMGG